MKLRRVKQEDGTERIEIVKETEKPKEDVKETEKPKKVDEIKTEVKQESKKSETNHKWSDEIVRKICEEYSNEKGSTSYGKLGTKYGVPRSTVEKMVKGINWKVDIVTNEMKI